MSSFNELVVFDEQGNELSIQFKAGIVWQYRYKLGETIKFDDGDPLAKGRHDVYGIASVEDSRAHYKLLLEEGAFVQFTSVSEAEYEQHHQARLVMQDKSSASK